MILLLEIVLKYYRNGLMNYNSMLRTMLVIWVNL